MSYGNDDTVRRLFQDISEAELSATVLSDARAKSDALIDSYLESAYPGHFPYSGTAPALVNSLSDDLTLYFCARAKYPGPAPLSSGITEEHWTKPMGILTDLSTKKILLPEIGLEKKIRSTQESYTPVFELDEETSWTPDSDRDNDVANSRD